MKRSRINQVIKDMEQLIKEHGFEMPPFAAWTAKEWQDIGHEYDEIRDISWAGILRTLALASSMRSDSRYLRSVTATRRCRRNIRRLMRRSF